MVNKTFLPPGCRTEKPLSHLQTCISSTGTAFAEKAANPSLAWESLEAFTRIRCSGLGEQRSGSHQGRTTDAEYASDRTFAADGAGTADGCRRQQRRERQHHGLQGRPLAVRRTSDAGRA